VTHVYNFDDFNYVNSYEVKEGNGSSNSIYFLIQPTGVNKTKYNGITLSPIRYIESEIIYENDKFINPRIDKTKLFYGPYTDETKYTYDKLGR
jgi:hypothetical protein